jgi:hypothetical protein
VSGQLHAPAALPPGERAPGTHWIGGWVDLRAGLDDMGKRKFFTLPGFELRVKVLQIITTIKFVIILLPFLLSLPLVLMSIVSQSQS